MRIATAFPPPRQRDTIPLLDWIEGCGGSDPLFDRAIQEINTENGKVWAYVYHYAQSLDSFAKIESGNWKSQFN